MMQTPPSVYVHRISAWAPGMNTETDWRTWAAGSGSRFPEADSAAPDVPFVPPLVKRRMSTVSKMTAAVLNAILPFDDNAKIVFVSCRGELSRQLKINSMVIEDGELLPAVFSTSVFNTPPALASIVMGLKGGYSALYPPAQNFLSAVSCAVAPLLTGRCGQVLFVYADEPLPDVYTDCADENDCPAFAFSAVFSSAESSSSVPFFLPAKMHSPADMLKLLLLQKCCFYGAVT